MISPRGFDKLNQRSSTEEAEIREIRMTKLLFLAALVLFVGDAAMAQVEPRVAGDWKDAQGRSWHIGSDGQYQATDNGQVVDSGKVTANEGSLKLQSSSGRTEEARFSMIGGQLQIRGGSLNGAWSKGASPMSSPYSTPAKPLSSPSFSNAPSTKPPIEAAGVKNKRVLDEQNKRALDEQREQRIIDEVAKRNQFSYDTATTTQRVNAQPSSNADPKFGGKVGARNYTDMFKTDHRTLPGYDPATADKPVMPNISASQNSVPAQNAPPKQKYSATIGEYVKNKLNQASPQDRSYYNQLMSEQHFNRPHQQGPQAVPQGGYIHVMKDKRARNYFQGK